MRQWVLSIPKRLRPFLHNNPQIASAVLLARIYGVLPLLCPACGGQMKILASPPSLPPMVISLVAPFLAFLRLWALGLHIRFSAKSPSERRPK
jgi:hypothetical protein